jgi:hypothetical protein
MPMVTALGLHADEPAVIAPPAPCHSFSGKHGGAQVHLVCFGESCLQSPLAGWLCGLLATECNPSLSSLLRAEQQMWRESLCVHCAVHELPQASARRLAWTMWALCLPPSRPTLPSKPSSQTSSSAQARREASDHEAPPSPTCLCQQGWSTMTAASPSL